MDSIFGILMGSILNLWPIFGSIFITELQFCHIMASNANKCINTVHWACYVMWIHIERAITNNTTLITPKFGLWQFSSPGFFEYFAFILVRKEAINKIQIDSRSRNDAPSSGKNFLFRKLVTCCTENILIDMWLKSGRPFTIVNLKKGSPL